MTIRWPIGVLPARSVAFDIAPRNLSAPANIYGVSQVVGQDAGIWRATLGDIVVRNRAAVIVFRGIATELEGRLGKILVPLCRGYQPLPDGATASASKPLPHSDGTFFSDGSGYVTNLSSVTLAANAPLRATTLSISIALSGPIEPGQHFSIGERLYRVKAASYISPTTATLTIRPPLREPALAGSDLNFDDPVCRMRLATDTEMDLSLEMRRFGNPTVNFVEDL